MTNITIENIFSVQMYRANLDGFQRLFCLHSLFLMDREVKITELCLKEKNLLNATKEGEYFKLKPIPEGKIYFQQGEGFTEIPIKGVDPLKCFDKLFELIGLHKVCKIEVKQDSLDVVYYIRKEGERLERYRYEASLNN